jgi:hypothetical protein
LFTGGPNGEFTLLGLNPGEDIIMAFENASIADEPQGRIQL